MSDAVEVVVGQQAVIRFEARRCIHSRQCVLAHPDVFVPNTVGAWIHPDAVTPAEIAEIAHNCPSGAIQYERRDGGPPERPPVVNLVRIRENGPLAVHAELNVGGDTRSTRATLCRCGASANKPYCDGSHKTASFKTPTPFTATGEPATLDSEVLPVRNGEVQITPTPNGPYMVKGSLELVSGTGRTLNRVTSTYLCRCGHSANKPYCDGSHARVGFVSEPAASTANP